MAGQALDRSGRDARIALFVIIAISALAFLVYEARRDVLTTLTIQQARFEAVVGRAARAADELRAERGLAGGAWFFIENDGLRRLFLVEAPSGRPIETVALPADRDLAPALDGQILIASSGLMKEALARLATLALGRPSDMPWEIADTGRFFRIHHGRLAFAHFGHQAAPHTLLVAPVTSLFDDLPWSLASMGTAVGLLAFLLLLMHDSRTSERSLRRLLDASPVPLLVLDAARLEPMLINAAARDLVGFGDTPALTLIRAALRERDAGGGAAAPFELEVREGGRRRWVLVSTGGLALHGRPILILGLAEVTELKDAEAALRHARDVAEAADRAKTAFVAMVSHELRTPINGVLGIAQLLEHEPQEPRGRRLTARLGQASRTLGAIIGDLLDIASLDAGRVRLSRRPFDPRETIEGAVALARGMSGGADVGVVTIVEDTVPATLVGDPDRLQQIVINLVGNSVKFTEAGSIAVSLRVDGAEAPGGRAALRLTVADTGSGIPEAVRPTLFEPFGGIEQAHERRAAGTGLGLPITRRLVEAMDGTIAFESIVGRGTVFEVRLPFGTATAAVAAAPPPGPRLKVLIVDDVAMNREVAAELTRGLGHEAVTASSGAAAIEAARATPPDVIVMDIRMPGLDGVGATRRIRADEHGRQRTPIIGLTANLAEAERPRYRIHGFDAMIAKPIVREELAAALQRVALQRVATGPAAAPSNGAMRQRLASLEARLGRARTRRIVALFGETARAAIEAIGESCAARDLAGLRDHAHRLAGAAANLGLEGLEAACRALEDAAAGDGPATADVALADATLAAALAVVAAWEQAQAELAALPAGQAPIVLKGTG